MEIYDMKIEVPSNPKDLNSSKWVFDAKSQLLIDSANMIEHAKSLTALIAEWNSLLAGYVKTLKEIEHDKEVWTSHRKSDVRGKLQAKSTESYIIECVIANNPMEYAKFEKDIIDMNYYIDLIKSVCKALDTKKEMLVLLGSLIK